MGNKRCGTCGWSGPGGQDCESPHWRNGGTFCGQCDYANWKPKDEDKPQGNPAREEGGRTMKKFPVEVWTKDDEGKRVTLLEKAPTFMEATSPENARDKVVIAITKLGAGVDDHEIVICRPLAV